uniref:NADH-ubiquinone oxidoreductase chain 3 n=1 Tax=Cryptocercus weixiensis TaxID=1980974 RepID=A0A8K1NMY9_9NEOP|nr:NADH dehydrogenase subunit 3 [Hemipenthes hebeiensis]YP_010227832.1 NADH dehydrogenase subunit 3 [Cryptocercus weixiensis]QVJ97670.1 NADH dehydrogenase subunit 3 [Hemipenthes hebeiensis]UDD86618.1 NADH dehydrogenase subunit 3 [Cryptocercus weixiensis]
MMMTTMLTILTLSISTIIMMMTSTISKKINEDREKASPFECGFDPSSSARMPFSLRFFLIAVIFLIFDVEIALILPMTIIMMLSEMKMWTTITIMFLFILLMGLYHEWNQGSLEWAN